MKEKTAARLQIILEGKIVASFKFYYMEFNSKKISDFESKVTFREDIIKKKIKDTTKRLKWNGIYDKVSLQLCFQSKLNGKLK